MRIQIPSYTCQGTDVFLAGEESELAVVLGHVDPLRTALAVRRLVLDLYGTQEVILPEQVQFKWAVLSGGRLDIGPVSVIGSFEVSVVDIGSRP
jgi:hypothetical protein